MCTRWDLAGNRFEAVKVFGSIGVGDPSRAPSQWPVDWARDAPPPLSFGAGILLVCAQGHLLRAGVAVTYTQALTHTHGHIRNRTLTLTHAHTHTCVLGHNHVQSPVRSFVSLHFLSSVCTLKPMRSLMPVLSLVLMLSHLYTLKLMHTLTPLHQQPCTHSC